MSVGNGPSSGGWQEDSQRPSDLNLAADFPVPTIEEWRQVATAELKGAEYDKKLLWQTLEGITVQPIYTRADIADLPAAKSLPGFPPYVRGTNPLSGVSPSWQIRQDCNLAAPEDVNTALRDGLARGQTAIGIRLDNAARQGIDGDVPEAEQLAGRGGCTLTSINGLRIALQDIDLEKHPVTMRTGSSALPVLAMLIALADERGISRRMLTGAVELDPVRELVKYGTLRGPISLYYRQMADVVSFCSRECPGIRGIIVNSSPYHNAGASATQELALTLAAGIEYMRALTERGIDADSAALGMIFSFSVSSNVFMEIAKLRAAKMLWAKIVKTFGAKSDDAGKMFLHVRTSTFTKTMNDPYNNIIRNAIEAFTAAVAGCESMYVAPFDEMLGRPDNFSMRVARNQQLLLKEEAYVSRVVDPAAGSYYVESLTDSVAREAWRLIQQIEADGGLVKSLEAGKVQKLVGDTAEKRKTAVARRRQPIVGVSNYANVKEKLPEKRGIPRMEFIAERRRRVNRLKAVRKNSAVRSFLTTLTHCVYTEEGNLLDVAVGAAREGATLGEMVRAMVLGSDQPAPVVTPIKAERISVAYEQLRARAAAFAAKEDGLPKVFLVPTGPAGMRRARVEFCAGFFSAGGFDVVEPEAFKSADLAASAVLSSRAGVAVVCSDDATYPEFVPELIRQVRAVKPQMLIYVAGYPEESLEKLKAAGTDGFVHIRASVVETLDELMNRLGIAPVATA